MLVEVVRDDDLDIGQAGLVKTGTSALRQGAQVTGIDTNARQTLAAAFHLAGNDDGVFNTAHDVVRVNEQGAVLGTRLRISTKRRELIGKRHDPGMGMGAGGGNGVALRGQHVGRRGASAHVGSARRRKGTVGTLGAAQAKLCHGAALGRLAYTRGLRCNKRLEVHEVEQRRLKQLTVDDGAADANHGLTRKSQIAVAQGVDRDTRAPPREPLEKLRREHGAAARGLEVAEIGNVGLRVAEILDKRRQLACSANERETALARVLPKERGEACLHIGQAASPIALRHSQLIQVGQQANPVLAVRLKARRAQCRVEGSLPHVQSPITVVTKVRRLR